MKLKPINKILIFLFLALVVIFFAVEIYRNNQFRITNTDPNTSSVSIISPYFKINFNKPLSSKGINLNESGGLGNSYSVSGESLTVNFSNTLIQNETYTITIGSIYDTSGSKITNSKFTFTAKNIPFNELSVDQQNKILKTQSKYKSASASLIVNGGNYLINNGVSSTQMTILTKDFKEFKPQAKSISISSNGIGIYPGSQSGTYVVRFSVNIDGTVYQADGSYTFLDNMSLSLYNASGTLVFNSAT